MLAARRRFGLSYPELGRMFRRDHTTVLHACRQAKLLEAQGGRFASDLRELVGEESTASCSVPKS
jgi:chromosomal replication initiation ATPase DnaA